MRTSGSAGVPTGILLGGCSAGSRLSKHEVRPCTIFAGGFETSPYSLIPVRATPEMKYRWAKKNIARQGSSVKIEAAIR